MSRYSNSEVLVALGQPNGQGQGGGAAAWAERWENGEGAMGWGGDLDQGRQGLGSRGVNGLGQGDSDITQKYS